MGQVVRVVAAVVVAAVVGYVTENPTLALEAFSLVYGVSGLFAPGAKTFGGKLNDLKAPQSSYGATIPYLRGSPRLAGIVIWSSDKREVDHTMSVGKGSSATNTTYTYEIDVLIEIASNRCTGLRRVFRNGALIWTNADESSVDSVAASNATDQWRAIRFYDGNPDQLPDPTYEAAIGVGRAPAYRSRTTIFIEGLNIGESGQIPVLTFEVVGPTGDVVYVEGQTVPEFGVPDADDGPFVSTAYTPSSVSFDPTGYTVHFPRWKSGNPTDRVTILELTTNPPLFVGEYSVSAAQGIQAVKRLVGNSDVSCLVTTDQGLSPEDAKVYRDVFGQSQIGDFVPFTIVGAQLLTTFARLGDAIVFLGFFGNTMTAKLARGSMSTGGNQLVTSAAVNSSTLVPSLALSTDGFCYLSAGASGVEQYDTATLAHIKTIPHPVSGNGNPDIGEVVCERTTLYSLGNYFYRLDDDGWTILDPDLLGPHIKQQQADTYCHAVVNGSLYNLYRRNEDTSNHFSVWTLGRTIPQAADPLDQVVRDLCLRTGQLNDEDIDVSQLVDDSVRALFITQVGPTRATLETLSGAFFFECVEGEKLKFVKRGQAAAATIPYADLGTSEVGDGEPTAIKRLNDIELPAIVTVKYANMAADFQDGAESGDRLTTDSTTQSTIELPLGFLPSEAKKVADATTMDLATSIQQIGPIALPMKYGSLEETDVVLVTDQFGDTIRARIVRTVDDASVLAFDLVVDDATVINSSAVSDDTYSSSVLVRSVPVTVPELMDIPALRDDDTSDVAFYAAAAAGPGWPGAELDRSTDGTSYGRIDTFAQRATAGVTVTALGPYAGANGFDDANVLRVNVGAGNLLSTATRQALLLSNSNACLIGDEIAQFARAIFVSDGIYDLSGWRRGLRGTEREMGNHVVAERFVMLDFATLRRILDLTVDVGRPVQYKMPTFGKSVALAPAIAFTNKAVSLRPFAPVDLTLDRGASPPILSWHRRSRLAGRFLAPGVLPMLGEASEAYSVDLARGSTVVTTLSSSTSSVAVPDAMPGDVATVYQLSAAVGRGFGASITL